LHVNKKEVKVTGLPAYLMEKEIQQNFYRKALLKDAI
jgi:hypothetical protein